MTDTNLAFPVHPAPLPLFPCPSQIIFPILFLQSHEILNSEDAEYPQW